MNTSTELPVIRSYLVQVNKGSSRIPIISLLLRGTGRVTEDLDIIIQASSPLEDADDGQLVCVDVLIAGQLNTPNLDADGAIDEIQPAIEEAGEDKKRVVSLRWQVRQKLSAGATRRKTTDYEDLQWLCRKHADEIRDWIEEEDLEYRKKFYQWALDTECDDESVERTKHVMRV